MGNLHLPLRELMDRNNDDLLNSVERDELEALVELSEQISLLRGEAQHDRHMGRVGCASARA